MSSGRIVPHPGVNHSLTTKVVLLRILEKGITTQRHKLRDNTISPGAETYMHTTKAGGRMT